MNEIRYVELFAGVGGFREGIRQAERDRFSQGGQSEQVDSYRRANTEGNGKDEQRAASFVCVYASEIDKHACAVYRHIWRGNGELREGDIREQDTDQVPDFDFLVAGFPCQSFSVAGQLGGFQDTRGTLFFEVARFLSDKRPRHFLLENVKGLLSHDSGKTFQVILGVLADLGYRVEWEVLNSTCWVPQNRERVFIVGHLGGECGRTVFPLREDGDVYPDASGQNPVANCLDSNYWKGWLDKGQRTMVAETAYTKGNRKDSRVRLSDAANNLDSGNSCAVALVEPLVLQQKCERIDVYRGETGALRAHGSGGPDHVPNIAVQKTSGQSITVRDNEVGCLQAGGANVRDKVPNVMVGHSRSREKDGSGRIPIDYHLKPDCGALKQPSGNQQDFVLSGHAFRRLTPVECERLQGWQDEHTALGSYRSADIPKSQRDNGSEYTLRLVSDTQRYRMAGNGVTADVVREVVKKMMLIGCFDDWEVMP